jgi:hypothetical protein
MIEDKVSRDLKEMQRRGRMIEDKPSRDLGGQKSKSKWPTTSSLLTSFKHEVKIEKQRMETLFEDWVFW